MESVIVAGSKIASTRSSLPQVKLVATTRRKKDPSTSLKARETKIESKLCIQQPLELLEVGFLAECDPDDLLELLAGVLLVVVEAQVAHLVQDKTRSSEVTVNCYSLGVDFLLQELELPLAFFLD